MLKISVLRIFLCLFLVLTLTLFPVQVKKASAGYITEYWQVTNSSFSVTNVTNSTAQVFVEFYREQNGDNSYMNKEIYRGFWPFTLKVVPLDIPGALPYTITMSSAYYDRSIGSSPMQEWYYKWNATINLPYPGTKYALYMEKGTEVERQVLSLDVSSIRLPASNTIIITTTGTKPPSVTNVAGIESRMDTTNARLDNIRLAINSLTTELDTTGNAIVTAENQVRDKLQGLVDATNQLVAAYNTQMASEVTALNGIKSQMATSLQGVQDAVNADRISPTLDVYWSGGGSSTTAATAVMKIYAVDDKSAVQVKINDGAWQAYTSSVTVSLALGVNTFVVFAKDAAGNAVTKKISIFRM